MKLKAEARLALLREASITVETWLKSAMNQVMEELENERWANLNAHDLSLSVSHKTHIMYSNTRQNFIHTNTSQFVILYPLYLLTGICRSQVNPIRELRCVFKTLFLNLKVPS